MIKKFKNREMYIFFTTGIIYKYGNRYIGCFGGKENTMMDAGEYIWRNSDIKTIYEKIERIREKKDFEKIDFNTYENTFEGTKQLRKDLVLHLENKNSHKKYLLGCLLYHQLQYKCTLKGHFTSGYVEEY